MLFHVITRASSTHRSPPARWIPIVVVVLGAAAVWLYVTRVSEKMPDLDVYLRAGTRAVAAEPLYRAEDSHYQFKYLPAFALLMVPFASMSLEIARALWFAGSLALLAALLYGSLRLIDASAGETHEQVPRWLLALVTMAVLGKFYAHELVLGQVNAPFAVTVVAALLAVRHGRETAAGALVALAIVLKPYGGLFVPWLLARRRRQSIQAVIVGLAVAAATPALIYGIAGSAALHRDWWQTVLTTTAPNLLNPDNVSWLAMFTRWFEGAPGPWPLTLLTISLVCAAAVAAWVWAYREGVAFPEGLEGALLLLLVPFLSPQGWDYVLLVATPAVMYVLAFAHRLPIALRWASGIALGVAGLTIYDVMGRRAYHAFMNASGVTICFLVVIAALAMLRLRRAL